MADRLDAPETLHVAPEACIGPWLTRISASYISIDLDDSAMVQMDLTAMTFDEASFSLVWCSNVLEHIPDDRQALREMYRVCKPGGLAVIQVPMWRTVTYEDPRITTEAERLEHFYQRDHVRLYGLDIVDRMREVGFEVTTCRTQDLPPAQIFRHALSLLSTNEVFLCRKA